MEMKVVLNSLEKNKKNLAIQDKNIANTILVQINKTRAAQIKWAKRSIKQRKKVMLRIPRIISFYADRIAQTIAECTGKTIFDALTMEVIPSAMAASFYAKAAHRYINPKKINSGNIIFFYKRPVLIREPWGVVGILSPWNYPFGIAFHELATALICGNGVMLKLATLAQPLGYWFKRILLEAGIPNHLVEIVNIPGAAAGPALIKAGIDKLFLTGSISVGKQLLKLASQKFTPLCLELGGNDAMIVCKDADLYRAAHGALWAGLSNTGHSCGGVERIYVHESIKEEFIQLLSKELSKLRISKEKVFDADIGNIATASQFDIIKQQVDEAVLQGAQIIAKIGKENRKQLLYPAMIVTNVDPNSSLVQQETFGTVLPVMTFQDEEQAIEYANSTSYGLTASIWSQNTRNAKQIALKLKAGAVMINDHLMSHALAGTPWGGYKESGIGRAHGESGFREMTQEKVVINDLLHKMPKGFYWFPHSKEQYKRTLGINSFLYEKHIMKKLQGLKEIIHLFISSFKK